jgi:integrase/recombinase XerD
MFICETEKLPLDKGLEKFINCKIAMNREEETIEYYQKRFTLFCDFLKKYKNIIITNQVTDECILDYILHIKQKKPNLSDHTINNNLRAVRAVLYYFMEKGYTDSFHIQEISVEKIPKEGYTTDEQEKLLKKPNIKKCSFPEYRNWVIICHLLASGIRSRTLRFIQIKHVNLKERIITLTEVKNKEGYEMPITDEYYPILCEYLDIRGGGADDYLFCNQYGKQISKHGLTSIISKHNKKCGVEKTSIHRFRNTFAKNWLKEGGSKDRLQYAFGHKSSKMVDEYARLYGRELREDFGKFTPLAKMKDTILENQKISMKKKAIS